MSNLSDLLPAGAAAKQLTFTDSGSGISSKAPVVVNSDGTIKLLHKDEEINKEINDIIDQKLSYLIESKIENILDQKIYQAAL